MCMILAISCTFVSSVLDSHLSTFVKKIDKKRKMNLTKELKNEISTHFLSLKVDMMLGS